MLRGKQEIHACNIITLLLESIIRNSHDVLEGAYTPRTLRKEIHDTKSPRCAQGRTLIVHTVKDDNHKKAFIQYRRTVHWYSTCTL